MNGSALRLCVTCSSPLGPPVSLPTGDPSAGRDAPCRLPPPRPRDRREAPGRGRALPPSSASPPYAQARSQGACAAGRAAGSCAAATAGPAAAGGRGSASGSPPCPLSGEGARGSAALHPRAPARPPLTCAGFSK